MSGICPVCSGMIESGEEFHLDGHVKTHARCCEPEASAEPQAEQPDVEPAEPHESQRAGGPKEGRMWLRIPSDLLEQSRAAADADGGRSLSSWIRSVLKRACG